MGARNTGRFKVLFRKLFVIVFTAIQKTGTTSIKSLLKENNTPFIKILDHGYLFNPFKNEEDKKKYWTGQGFKSKIDNSEAYYENDTHLTVVRNPFDILVSYHYHNWQYGWANVNRIHETYKWVDFVNHYLDPDKPWHLPPMKKSMFSFIYDKNDNMYIDGYFKLENIHKLNTFFLTLNLPKLKNTNRTEYKVKNYRDYYTTEQVKALSKLWEKDLDYFKYTF